MSDAKVAIVTGAGSGIGRGSAEALMRAGYRVAAIGRRAGRLAAKPGERLHPFPCDVADAKAVGDTVARIRRELGRIDLLVNAAGVNQHRRVADITAEHIDYVLRANLYGTIHMCQAAIPALIESGGTIVNIGSLFVSHPLPAVSIYAASKGGVEAYTRALAIELGPQGVRVNCVSPGPVRSELLIAQGMSPEAYAQRMASFAPGIPLKRVGEPADVADAVVYLAAASWVTGAVLAVDGGRSIGTVA
jgi:NAD(P)-dependent dehydrogenase (short-subunit alcohol dehydrogenase family)